MPTRHDKTIPRFLDVGNPRFFGDEGPPGSKWNIHTNTDGQAKDEEVCCTYSVFLAIDLWLCLFFLVFHYREVCVCVLHLG